MPDFERIPPPDKRDALRDLVESVFSRFGEDFTTYTNPITPMLDMENRMTRRSIQENANGEIRHAEIFIDGPEDATEALGGSQLIRSDGRQFGSIDAVRLILWYGLDYDSEGNIVSYSDWWDLLTGYDPKGLFPTIRETRSLTANVGGDSRTLLVSTVREPVTPAIPRPVQGTGGEYAHYAEASVSLTDM